MKDTDLKNDDLEEEFVETNEDGEELSGKDQLKRLRGKLKEAVAEKQKYLENWQRDKAEFINARRRDEEAKTDYSKFAEAKMVEEMLTRGVEQGHIRPDINSKILARMRMAQVEIGFNPELFPPDKFKILDVQISMLEHFLYGICTLKGHKLINKHKQIIEEE